MKKFAFNTTSRALIADTITPVSIYLKLRDHYPKSILLESTDHGRSDNSFSYICFNPIASIKAENKACSVIYPDTTTATIQLSETCSLVDCVEEFKALFSIEPVLPGIPTNGLFGFTSFNAVQHFDAHTVSSKAEDQLPDLHYQFYRNVIVVDHYHNQAYLIAHNFNQDHDNLDEVEAALRKTLFASYGFTAVGEEQANCNDRQFLEMVDAAKQHCQRGDVFQMVMSRRFSQPFSGDEFNVYRALRSVNPSPYLFYFDYGDFKVFGSSPEAQLRVLHQTAEIHPIAGTFKRTGNDVEDQNQAKLLAADAKENAEHVMLVDLARNDLSRHGTGTKVAIFKELQLFSHVIHMVSKVTTELHPETRIMQLAADTFPAGTLSGAPKFRALQLIEKYEPTARGLYGGAIGFMGFDGSYNHAIIIRSFVSVDQELRYQAGAGVVVDSVPEKELDEVNNKLAALRKAMQLAQTIQA